MEIFQNKILGTKIASAPGGQFFAVEKSIVKIEHIAEFTTSKFFTFNDFFHFPGLNWSKATHI